MKNPRQAEPGSFSRNADPFPVHKLKRVDRPTTVVREGDIKRVREREAGFNRARLGEYGPVLQREVQRFVAKHPLSGSQIWMMKQMIPLLDGIVATCRAPLPEDRGAVTRHIKETAYFLRADLVGVCGLGHEAPCRRPKPCRSGR